MKVMNRRFMLYEDTYQFIHTKLIRASLDPLVTFRVLEVNPKRMGYLVEVTSNEETWWQWIYEGRRLGPKMHTKPRRKKPPTR